MIKTNNSNYRICRMFSVATAVMVSEIVYLIYIITMIKKAFKLDINQK